MGVKPSKKCHYVSQLPSRSGEQRTNVSDIRHLHKRKIKVCIALAKSFTFTCVYLVYMED